MDDSKPQKERKLYRRLEHPIISGLIVAGLGAFLVAVYHRLSEPSELEAAETSTSQLTDGINIERFKDALGTPDIVRALENEQPFTESLWITSVYAVQTVSDSAGQVALYSLTTRDPGFAPLDRTFEVPLGRKPISGYHPLKIDIGKTVSAWRGPTEDWYYSEGHNLGGGVNKTIVFTASAAGLDQAGDVPDIQCRHALCPVRPQDVKSLNRLRTGLTATTYTVLNEDLLPVPSLSSDFRFGPSRDMVDDVTESAANR